MKKKVFRCHMIDYKGANILHQPHLTMRLGQGDLNKGNDPKKQCVICPLWPLLATVLTSTPTHFLFFLHKLTTHTHCTHIVHTCLYVFCFQLFDLVYREETLLNVIKSVTRNGRSIVLTAVLALILVYLFSIVGYIFFKDDFILAVDRIPNKTLGTLKYMFPLIPLWGPR